MRSEAGIDVVHRRAAHAASSRTLRLVAAICLPCLPASASAQAAGASTFDSAAFAPMTLAPTRGMQSARDKQNAATFYDMATSGRGLTKPIDAYDVIQRGKQLGRLDLGARYADTRGAPKQTEAALAWARGAAKQDNREVMFLLGRLLLGSTDVATRSEGLDWLKRAAELGLPEAQYELGIVYFEGRGTAKDREAALTWWRKAAGQGNAMATLAMAQVLLESEARSDRDEGLALLNRSAEEGRTEAIIALARIHARGEFGFPVDEARAEALLKPAAERGDPECQYALASLYKFGKSFVQQRDLYKVWLQRAAESGHARAFEILRDEK